tara:strand:+ start:212 stop:565 length:354 start_codon:yes stop_codon:yes gene_type:complete
MVLVGACMAALVGLMFLSIEPQTQYSIDEVMSSPDSHEGDVHLRGQVAIDSLDKSSFSFELAGQDHSLQVNYSDVVLPNNFVEGLTIAIKGNLVSGSSGWLLEAQEIQTGCPSKYSE